ncbi:MAG: hypothetical protein AAGA94_13620, partial [Pseudomonadota bacterium]
MSDLMITGVVDGDLSGGLPKAIQIYALNDIPDLSIYGVGSANNGNGGGVEEFTFPADAIAAGTTLHISTETDSFTDFFGFAPEYTDSVASINGDDAIELFRNGVPVDVFGNVNASGAGDVWEYTDGWASRDPAVGANPTFDPADWSFSGPGGLADVTSNAAADTPFPIPGDTGGAPAVAINEYRISSGGSSDDTSNFVELVTEPNTSLEGKTLLVLSGEFAPGQIDRAIDLSSAVADENGFVLVANDQNPNLGEGDIGVADLDFFGSPQTFLIVDGFTGNEGDDLDPDDDGTLNTTPWAELIDSVAGVDGDATPDQAYSDTVIPGDGNFPAAGAARQVDGTGDFVSLPFGDTAGDTPGATNTPDAGPERVTIMDIQGAGHVSGLVSDTPLDPTTGGGAGPRVLTTGIVTAIDSNGFYMQD